MGAFFTNIQLKKSSADVSEIVDFLTRQNTNEGFIKVDHEVDADKSIIIQQTNNSPWISIYDEELEDQGSRKLNKVAVQLSKQFNTTALSILVHDSDSMYVGLNIKGALKDSLSNLSKEINFDKCKPEAWKELLSIKYTFDDVKTAWKKKNLFVEEFLTAFANLIEIDSSKLLTGYEYLSEEGLVEGIKLNFVKKDKKVTPLGLTKIALVGTSGPGPIKLGEKGEAEWFLTNHGDLSDGLDIVISGQSIEKGYLVPTNFKISYVKERGTGQGEFKGTFSETVATSGEKMYYARLENFHLPKGFAPNYPMTNGEVKRYMKIRNESAFKCNIEFLGQKIGDDELLIFFAPRVNRQDGSYCSNFSKGQVI